MRTAALLLLVCPASLIFAQAPDGFAAALAPGTTNLADDSVSDRLIAATAQMKTDDRVAMLEKLAEYKPDNLHYQNLLAGVYIQKMRETTDFGYIDRASRIVQNVLSLEPVNYEAMRLRSEIGLERHQFSQVAEWSREMTKIAPDDAWNWGTLGDASMELGQHERAAEAYQRMVTLRPNQSSYNRASYYRWVMGDTEGAIDIMRRAVASGSPSLENTAWCLVDLGNLYFKTGHLQDATQAYNAALQMFPGYHPAHAGLARVLAAEGRDQPAIENFRRAQASVPLPEYAASLAELYERTGNKTEARHQLELLDVIDKMGRAAGEQTNRNLALIFADLDRNLQRSLDLATAELKVRGDVYTYDALAWSLYKNGRLEAAEQAAQKALMFHTPEPGFYFHAGMIASALNRKADAEKYLRRALSLNPHFDPRQAPVAEAALRNLLAP